MFQLHGLELVQLLFSHRDLDLFAALAIAAVLVTTAATPVIATVLLTTPVTATVLVTTPVIAAVLITTLVIAGPGKTTATPHRLMRKKKKAVQRVIGLPRN